MSRRKIRSRAIQLEAAVKSNDIEKVRELLDEGVNNPIHTPFIHLAMTKNHIEIVKLLVQHCKANVHLVLERYCCESKSGSQFFHKELFAYIVQLYGSDTKLIQKIFQKLVVSSCRGPLALEIFELLLDSGLPLDDFIEVAVTKGTLNRLKTPLIHSIATNRVDFVYLLLELGADVNKNTADGSNPLFNAVVNGNVYIVEMLLKRGASVNAKSLTDGKTALHAVLFHPDFTDTEKRMIRMLLKYGADVNIPDHKSLIPLKDLPKHKVQFVIRELAKSRFGGQLVCRKNLDHLEKYGYLKKLFDECLIELQKMKSFELYKNLSLYDILKMKKQPRKLILLTKDEDFVTVFRLCWNPDSYSNYGFDLNDIFEKALKKRDALLQEEQKIASIFKDILSESVITEISYFTNEHLFNESSR